MNLILTLSIISFFLQNLIGYLKFKKIINPIFLFNIIHFFHNWSFSFSKYFNEMQIWNAPLNLSFWSMYEVLHVNLVGSWMFFFMIILFSKTRQYKQYMKYSNSEKLLTGYYFLSAVFFISFIINYDPNLAYGANQDKDAMSAFNPISQIIFFRVIMCIQYVFSNNVTKKTILKIILIELFFSAISFKRKDLILIVSSYLLKSVVNSKIEIFPALRYLLTYSMGLIFLMLIPIYRSVNNYVDGFSNVINEVIIVVGEYGSQISFYLMNLTNSEGIQNWTYQLVYIGEMPLQYGKSYLQAIINMFILRPFQGADIASWQGAYYFKKIAYPDTTNNAWDYSFSAEAIQNFGSNFAFISFAILGLIISLLYSLRNKGDFNKLLYYCTWPILIIGFRGDSTALLRMYSYVIIIFIYFYLSKKIEKLSTQK